MPLPYFDSFNNGNVTQDINVYNPSYIILVDLTLMAEVLNNTAANKSANNSTIFGYNGGTYNADHGIRVIIAGNTVNYANVVVRCSGDKTLFNCQGYQWQHWAGTLNWISGGGVPVTLVSGLTIPNVGDELNFRVVGQELRYDINGVPAGSYYTDSTPFGPTSGGIAGMGFGNPVSGFDAFINATFYNVTSGSTKLFREPSLSGIGNGGPFFRDPLQ